MILELEQVSKTVGAETHLYPLNLRLQPGTINVLLGTTQAGKTSLMRLMAGLDRPDQGRVLVDGKDVTGVSVRQRNLAMVYQQFINYPGLSVFENIAAPLRILRCAEAEIRERVNAVAAKLHIEHLLQRLPGALSGGQQQRTALARALVKRAPLMLLDEPLVNLDYKLREELRDELTSLFTSGDTTVVYATTEPQEALLLGGYTAVLDAGRVLQFGPSLATWNAPGSVRVAAIFNDPPMNIVPAKCVGADRFCLADGTVVPLPGRGLNLSCGQECLIGVRCHHLQGSGKAASVVLECVLDLAELSGSETYLHLHHGGEILVAQWPGIHDLSLDSALRVYFQPEQVFVFDKSGALVSAPAEA